MPSCAELFKKQKALTVEIKRETRRIPYDLIYSLVSKGRRVLVFGETPYEPLCTYYGKLSELPAGMFECDFLRVGRSAVVNLRYVQRINGYKVHLCNGVELSVSRACYASVRSAFLEWRGLFGDN